MLKNRILKTAVAIVAFTFFICHVAAQHLYLDYKPRLTYTKSDELLLDRLDIQLKEEKNETRSFKRDEINKIYDVWGKRLRRMVLKKELIKDDSLQQFLENIVDRLENNTSIQNKQKIILIHKNPSVNAVSCADGTLLIFIGIMSKITSESQLAFAIAHEIAHFELQHIRKKITSLVERDLLSKEKENLKQLFSDRGSTENMEALRELWYAETSFSREHELEADSLGFAIFKNAGYSQHQATILLSLLDETKLPNDPEFDFILQFDLKEYPLKEEWFKKRLSVFKSKPVDLFFLEDSLHTHPDIEYRKEILNQYVQDRQSPLDYQPVAFVGACILTAKFEAIESAYSNEQYDLCLYLALKLRTFYPQNSYLVSMISKVLIGLCEAKDFTYDFGLLLPKKTTYYNEELRFVNDFLNNLKKDELGDIAYFFLNDNTNFSTIKEEHYYLLWKACNLTNRKEIGKKIKREYLETFTGGEYRLRMILSQPYKSKLSKIKHRVQTSSY